MRPITSELESQLLGGMPRLIPSAVAAANTGLQSADGKLTMRRVPGCETACRRSRSCCTSAAKLSVSETMMQSKRSGRSSDSPAWTWNSQSGQRFRAGRDLPLGKVDPDPAPGPKPPEELARAAADLEHRSVGRDQEAVVVGQDCAVAERRPS